MNRTIVKLALVTAGGSALAISAAADARPVYVKYNDEAQAADTERGEWIEIVSLRVAGARFKGGVSVAAGDVTGDGATTPPRPKSGDVTLKRGTPGASGQVAGPSDIAGAVPAGLLLPAVQKVREAAARRSARTACTPGARLGPVAVRNGDTGATGRILDAATASCSAEQVVFTFSKIEWDS